MVASYTRKETIDMKIIKVAMCISLIFIILSSLAFSQNKQVRDALRKIASGKMMEAKGILAELQEAGHEDPAIMYLQGVLSEDAYKAVSIYQKIVADYPQSEWSDDSYWRLVQFYAVKGDTARAVKELDVFRAKHPASEFLSPAMDLVNSALSYHRTAAPSKRTIPPIKPNPISAEKKEAIAKYNEKQKAEKANAKDASKTPDKAEETNFKSWGLQLGVFSTIESAKAEADKLKLQRLRNEIVEKEVNGKKMFAVIVGNYTSKESAEKNKSIVEKVCGCETIIYGKK